MIATNDIEQAAKQVDLAKENNTLKQTINGLLDLDDQRLRKIEALKVEYERSIEMNRNSCESAEDWASKFRLLSADNKRLTEELKAWQGSIEQNAFSK